MTTHDTSVSQINEDQLPVWAKDATKLPIKFIPASDRVVVFPDPERKVSGGGLMMSGHSKGKIEPMGTVIAVGPGKVSEYTNQRLPMELAVGQRILFGMFTGDDYLLTQEGYLIPYSKAGGMIMSNTVLVKVLTQGAVLATL